MTVSRESRRTPPGPRPALPSWAVVSPARLEHIERVAALASRWAEAMGVPDTEWQRWLRAIWLHDALRDAPEEELEKWAPSSTPGAGGTFCGRAGAAAKATADVASAARSATTGSALPHAMGCCSLRLVKISSSIRNLLHHRSGRARS